MPRSRRGPVRDGNGFSEDRPARFCEEPCHLFLSGLGRTCGKPLLTKLSSAGAQGAIGHRPAGISRRTGNRPPVSATLLIHDRLVQGDLLVAFVFLDFCAGQL